MNKGAFVIGGGNEHVIVTKQSNKNVGPSREDGTRRCESI